MKEEYQYNFFSAEGDLSVDHVNSATPQQLQEWFRMRMVDGRDMHHPFDPQMPSAPHQVFCDNFSMFIPVVRTCLRGAAIRRLREFISGVSGAGFDEGKAFSLFAFISHCFQEDDLSRLDVIEALDFFITSTHHTRATRLYALQAMVGIRRVKSPDSWNALLDRLDGEEFEECLGLISVGILQSGLEAFLGWLSKRYVNYDSISEVAKRAMFEWEGKIYPAFQQNRHELVRAGLTSEQARDTLRRFEVRKALPAWVMRDIRDTVEKQQLTRGGGLSLEASKGSSVFPPARRPRRELSS